VGSPGVDPVGCKPLYHYNQGFLPLFSACIACISSAFPKTFQHSSIPLRSACLLCNIIYITRRNKKLPLAIQYYAERGGFSFRYFRITVLQTVPTSRNSLLAIPCNCWYASFGSVSMTRSLLSANFFLPLLFLHTILVMV